MRATPDNGATESIGVLGRRAVPGHHVRVIGGRRTACPLKATLGFLLSIGATFGGRCGLPVGLASIVPAVMPLLDRAAWWLPRWLDRSLPKVDVEGANLATHADAVPSVRVPTQGEPSPPYTPNTIGRRDSPCRR